MALRDDLQPCVDDARALVDELGLRPFSVVIRTRTWPGEPGLGVPVDADLVLDPVPRVRPPAPRHVFAAPGQYEDGDRIVDRISRSYGESDLDHSSAERIWLIGGEQYRLVGKPLKRNFEWRVQLRRMAR